jgi:hypothetical protein
MYTAFRVESFVYEKCCTTVPVVNGKDPGIDTLCERDYAFDAISDIGCLGVA